MANEEQRDYWNDQAGPKWVEHQARLDSMLAEVTDALNNAIAVQASEAVLDIGCGTGELSCLLASQGAKVIGVDLSQPMIDAAQRRSADYDTQFLVADAAETCFDMVFDAAVSRFGVMFFDDPTAAFANIRANMTTGGRLVFCCWKAPQENAWAMVPAMAVKPLLPEEDVPDLHAPGPFAFADPDRVRGILEGAGFSQVHLAPHTVSIALSDGGGLDDATNFACQIGPGAKALGELGEAGREQARAAIYDALGEHVSRDGEVRLPGAIWLVSAES